MGGCAGLFVLVGVAGMALGQLVLVPYATHQARIPACRSNRMQLLEKEQAYRKAHGRYTSNLDALFFREGQVPAWYHCPDKGTYRASFHEPGKRLVLYCSIPDHEPVSVALLGLASSARTRPRR